MQHPPKTPLRSTQKRKRIALSVLLFCLCIATASLLIMSIRKTGNLPFSPEENALNVTLQITDPSEIDTISIHPTGENASYLLRCRENSLFLVLNDQEELLNEQYASGILNAATQIVVQDQVKGKEEEILRHLTEMGLNPPAAYAEIRYQNGEGSRIEIGYEVPNTTFSYFRYSGAEGVYMCDSGTADAFRITQERLLSIPQISVEAVRIEQVSIHNAYADMVIDFGRDSLGSYYGYLKEPLNYPLSSEQCESLLASLQNIRLGSRVIGPIADEEVLGFDQPLCTLELHLKAGTVSQLDENGQISAVNKKAENLTLVLGRSEGEYFYTCKYQEQAYLVSKFLFEALIQTKPSDIITKTPANLGNDAFLSCVILSCPTGNYTLEAAQTENLLPNNALETDENGSIVHSVNIFLNQEKITEDRYNAILSQLQKFTVSGTLPSGWTPRENDPRWSLFLETESGVIRNIVAYRLDSFNDALVVDGTPCHYLSNEAVDILVAAFQTQE